MGETTTERNNYYIGDHFRSEIALQLEYSGAFQRVIKVVASSLKMKRNGSFGLKIMKKEVLSASFVICEILSLLYSRRRDAEAVGWASRFRIGGWDCCY